MFGSLKILLCVLVKLVNFVEEVYNQFFNYFIYCEALITQLAQCNVLEANANEKIELLFNFLSTKLMSSSSSRRKKLGPNYLFSDTKRNEIGNGLDNYAVQK